MKAELIEFYKKADKTMSFVVISLFLFSLALAIWHDTWGQAILIGIPSAAIPLALIYLSPGSLTTRFAVATSFMVFAALQIQQSHGVVELHFGIFVLLAFLLYYRDWSVIVAAAAIIAVHHLLFNYLQDAGYPVYVFASGPSLAMVFYSCCLCNLRKWLASLYGYTKCAGSDKKCRTPGNQQSLYNGQWGY